MQGHGDTIVETVNIFSDDTKWLKLRVPETGDSFLLEHFFR